MSGHIFAAEIGGEAATVDLSGGNITFVYIVLAIAVIALVLGAMFRRQVLAAGEGTTNMQNIAQAVQEGASAFLGRQFRTLGVFAVAAFVLLFLLPAEEGRASASAGRSSSWSGPASRPRSATSACRWRCAPTSAWPRPPAARAETRPCGSRSAPVASSAWRRWASDCWAPPSW